MSHPKTASRVILTILAALIHDPVDSVGFLVRPFSSVLTLTRMVWK
jgi:hypothetical protein